MNKLPSPKKSGRGGARPGAGRKPGSGVEKKYGTVLEALERPEMEGLTPITVMLDNMKYYHDRANDFDAKLSEVAEIMTPQQIAAGGEEVIELLKLVAKIGEFRMKAQECAVDAAPYVHPRLAAMAVKVSTGDSKKPPPEITKQMTPQLAADAYAQLLAEDA